jgi:hypothetical protein
MVTEAAFSMKESLKSRIVGRNWRRTLIQLTIASIVVGAALALFGISPGEFWRSAFNALRGVVGAIGDSVGEVVINLATYLLFGAAIVVPIYLVSRLLARDPNDKR